jgi:hypothetical protein
MPLTPTQKSRLNTLLAQYPYTSTRSTILADMWELLPDTPGVNAVKAQWKAETLALITGFQASVTEPFTAATDALNNA